MALADRMPESGPVTEVLDVSNYDADTFDAACIKASGFDGIILGCQRRDIARMMAKRAVAADLPILGVYAYLYFAGAEFSTSEAIDIAKEFGVDRVWLDVEDVSTNLPPISERIAIVHHCADKVLAAGLHPGIYTGKWYWIPQMGNTTEFSELPLWHSAYLNGDGTPFEVRSVDYGGWTDVAVHQWTSTLDVCGRKRDANHYYLEEGMTPEEKAKLDAVYAALTGGVDGVIEKWNTNGNSVLVAYNDLVFPHINAPGGGVPDHKHQTSVMTTTTGGPVT